MWNHCLDHVAIFNMNIIDQALVQKGLSPTLNHWVCGCSLNLHPKFLFSGHLQTLSPKLHFLDFFICIILDVVAWLIRYICLKCEGNIGTEGTFFFSLPMVSLGVHYGNMKLLCSSISCSASWVVGKSNGSSHGGRRALTWLLIPWCVDQVYLL